MKTLMTRGSIVSAHGLVQGDILLENGVITAIEARIDSPDAHVIDATGLYVLPGGIDAHTHITLNLDAAPADVYAKGTLPALMGGTTTIVDHLCFGPAERSLTEHLALYLERARARSVVDYAFHGVAQGDLPPAALESLLEQGCSGIKAYMTYDFMLDDAALLRLLRHCKDLGMLVEVHAENHAIIRDLRAQFEEEGKCAPQWHPRSRPAFTEAEAVSRLLHLAAAPGDAPVYIVHLSTAQGLAEIIRAKDAGQRNIFAETCTQYLTLTEDCYQDPVDGLNYIMSPPLRTQEDCDALWQGIRDGHIQTIATDHCAFTKADKLAGQSCFTRCPGGAPGLEERMRVLFSYGVAAGRITLQQYVDALSTMPARLMGLYPQKGVLAPGSDADILLLDPHMDSTVRAADMHGPGDYSIYEGMRLTGGIRAVYLRGRLVARDNEFLGASGQGHFVRRRRGTYQD